MIKLRANESTAYDSFITSKNSIDESSSSSLLDIDVIRPKLKTEPNTAFFWPGITDGIGGVTLESTVRKQKAVIGSKLRPGNIWENIGLPRLKNSPNITKITTIDPKTGIEHVIEEDKIKCW